MFDSVPVARMLLLLCMMLCLAICRGGLVPHSLAECTHNDHCGPSSCCLVGFNRYSIPSCSPLGDIDSSCRMGNQRLRDRSFYYPNDIMIEVESAYWGLCPCRPGLFCSTVNSTCQSKAYNIVHNSIQEDDGY